LLASIFSFAAPPTIATSNLSFPSIQGASFNIAWTAGNGARRIIVARAGSPVSVTPQNGVDYTANTIFGSGQAIAPGQFVIYNSPFTSFFLTGLTPGTQYFFAFFEYNGSGATTEYLTSSFLTGTCSTVSAPTIQTINMTFSNITGNSVVANMTAGNGARRLVLIREGSPVNEDPVDLHSYGGTNVFGTGTQIGAGNYVVYSSSGSSTSFGNLQPGTTYHFAVYEFNGTSEPVYLKPAFRTTVTTRTVPTIPSSNIITVITDGKELTFNWTSGNGLRRIMVARQGSAVTAVPADGVAYNANPVFGSGTAIAPGEFVVYDGNFNSTKVSGLNPATVYHFRIYEYDGDGTNNIYLKNLFGQTSASTAVTPTVQASAITAINISGTSLQLKWNNGNGKGRFVVARKDAAVNIVPQDFTQYVANSSFGNGQQLGTGNFVLGYSLSTGLIVGNLEPSTTYHFAIFEYNGLNQPMYLSPAAVFSVSTSGTIPVKLSQWKGAVVNEQVQLKWVTETEINASHFSILRSTDGSNFHNLQNIPATGNSQLPVHYTAVDDRAPQGRVYYKLAMVDKDGHTEYSAVISLYLGGGNTIISKLLNPVSNTVKVYLNNSAITGKLQWRIVDAGGKLYSKGLASSDMLSINIDALPAGIYWLQVLDDNKHEVKTFNKL